MSGPSTGPPPLDAARIEELVGALVTISPDGTILDWNSGAAALFGFTSSFALGRSIFDTIVPAEQETATRDWLAKARETGSTAYEAVRRHQDGSVLFVDAVVRQIPGTGADHLLLLNERDVTRIKYQRDAQALQSRFRGVLDAAPDAFVLVDRFGRIALANPELERLFGYAAQDLLGQPVELLVPDRYRGNHPGHRSGYFADPRTRPMGSGIELSARRKDGSEFPVEISLSPLDVEGVTLAIAAIRDVSGRKKNEAKFRALLEAAPDAMVIVDRLGLIHLINSQCERLFGYQRQELVGQPVELLVPLRFREGHPAHRAHYFGDPHPRPMGSGLELWARRKDGSEFPVAISLSPVETEEGTLVTAAVRDISELVAVNRELETFTYSVSHDLRAPLRQIDGFARILLEDAGDALSEKARHCIGRIQEGTQRMGSLVDDLLKLAQIGRADLHRRTIELTALTQHVVTELGHEWEERDVEWRIGELPACYCDPGLVKIVFTNLLSNAIKYTRPRRPAIIEVALVEHRGRPAFLVRDNGVGFDMRYADKLFGVFQRLHSPGEFEGTGVGLATVQRIVHKHGGEIWAEARPDQGAAFYFTLPDGANPAPQSSGSARTS
jgi:protein-histidine pros-kinase